MAEVNENAGRERRQHDRFVVHKRIEVSTFIETFNGVLRDISVGGAAIKVWPPLYQADIVSIDINVLGEFEGLGSALDRRRDIRRRIRNE